MLFRLHPDTHQICWWDDNHPHYNRILVHGHDNNFKEGNESNRGLIYYIEVRHVGRVVVSKYSLCVRSRGAHWLEWVVHEFQI
jgi:hypothetical protein